MDGRLECDPASRDVSGAVWGIIDCRGC